MSPSRERVLLGDVGGTNARLALLESGRVGSIETLPVAGYPQFSAALKVFFAACAGPESVSGAVLAVAGPVENGRSALTNSAWVIDTDDLRKSFDWEQVRLVNDFEALGWSLPRLGPTDLVAIGGGYPVPAAPSVVLGPGTGLGIACYVPAQGGGVVVASEGGHATLPGTCPREDEIIAHLRGRFGHVSAERVLSGEGLVNLYQAIGAIDRRAAVKRSAAEITRAALGGECPVCRQALDMFCDMLGTFAGSAALTFGARGGVYIAGGIVPRIVTHVARSAFRSRFEAKGRFKPYLAKVPTWLITHPDPAFVGLQWLAEQTFVR